MLRYLAIALLSTLCFGQSTGGVKLACESDCPVPSNIVVSVSPSTIPVGGTSQATAQLNNADGSANDDQTKFCQWDTSNHAIATITTAPNYIVGKITGVSAGSANAVCIGPTGFPVTAAAITVSAPPIITYLQCGSPPCALPTGSQGNVYNLQFLQSGGTVPIVWSKTGTLPTGLSLTSGGLLSGTPSGTGSSSFSVTVTAANGNATQSYTLNIVAATCGYASGFACSSANITTATNVTTSGAPFSGLGGMGRYVASPCPGCPGVPAIDNAPMYQLTDETLAYGASANHTMGVNCDGNGFDRSWAADEKHMATCDGGNAIYIWNNTLGPPFSSVLGFKATSNTSMPSFSTTVNNRYYYFSGTNPTQIVYSDATDPTQAKTVLVDMATANGWVPALGGKHTDSPTPNRGDTLWVDGFSFSGSQGTGRLVVAYVGPGGFVAQGLYLINLQNLQMWGPSGLIGSYNPSHGTFKIHQVATGDGNYAMIASSGPSDAFNLSNIIPTNALTHSPAANYAPMSDGTVPIVGESIKITATTNYNGTFVINSITPATNTVSWAAAPSPFPGEPTGLATVVSDHGSDPFVWVPGNSDLGVQCGPDCGGHWVPGLTNFINDTNTSKTFSAKSIASPGTVNFTFPQTDPCTGHQAPWDTHMSIATSGADLGNWMFVSSSPDTTTGGSDFTKPCTEEAMGYLMSNSTTSVKRFGIQWSDPTWHFNTNYFIMNSSPLGNFLDMSSNMGSSLGDGAGNPTCVKGTKGGLPYNLANPTASGTCAAQVFVIDLRQQ